MNVEHYLYYVYYTFLGMPFIIRISMVFLGIFFPIYILGCHITFRFIRAYLIEKTKLRYLTENYEDKLYYVLTNKQYLLASDMDKLLDTKVKKLNKRDKKIFTKLIAGICRTASFVNYDNKQILIDYLNIQLFWEKRLKHGNKKQKLDALRRLDDLQTKISGAVLTNLTYNRNNFLRKRSRSSYLKSTRTNPYKFLEEDFDDSINQWDKIELHDILEKHFMSRGIPNLARWLFQSSNIEFQCFIVDEIAFFNQQESTPILIQLIKESENRSILPVYCINALGEMQCREVEPELLKIFPLQSHHVQRAIIKTIGKLKTQRALPFLIDVYHKAIDDERRILILSVIYSYGEMGREYFDSIQQKQNKEDFSYLIFEHVSNPLLTVN